MAGAQQIDHCWNHIGTTCKKCPSQMKKRTGRCQNRVVKRVSHMTWTCIRGSWDAYRTTWPKNMVTRTVATLRFWLQCTKTPYLLTISEWCVWIMWRRTVSAACFPFASAKISPANVAGKSLQVGAPNCPRPALTWKSQNWTLLAT